jgi:hypothetical protein
MNTSEDTHRHITYGKWDNIMQDQIKADSAWQEYINNL